MTTRLLKLTLSYDGTRFVGWQSQKNGQSVQETLEAAFKQLTGKKVRVTGAGRTDSGVHAMGQVAHANVLCRLSVNGIRKALNAILPEEIVVHSVQTAAAGFHARYSARSKWYRYQIWNSPVRPLVGRERMHHITERLDLGKMRRAARALSGKRDFKAFQSAGRGAPAPRHFLGSEDGTASVSGTVRSTVRTVRLKLSKQGPLITLDAQGNGFLYHMVRRLAGLLIAIGKGRLPPEGAVAVLRGTSRFIPPSAPAKGLCLIKVRY